MQILSTGSTKAVAIPLVSLKEGFQVVCGIKPSANGKLTIWFFDTFKSIGSLRIFYQ